MTMIEAYLTGDIIAMILAILAGAATVVALARAAARERAQLETFQRQQAQEYGCGRERLHERQQEHQVEPEHGISRSADDDYAPRVMRDTSRSTERLQERGHERGGLER